MNLIVICTDSFRADYLGCYGNEWIETPYLDRFASDSVLFESAWGESLPTIQARRVYFTGRSLLPFPEGEVQPKGVWPGLPGWLPLREDVVSLSEYLSDQGYFSGLITDVWHYFKPAMNLHRGFSTWQFVRGQESDPWRSAPNSAFDTRDYVPEHLWSESADRALRQYLVNTQDFRREEDYFCASTFRSAVRWLENNVDKKPFFLWVGTFDPHEPWDCPREYALRYHDDYPCERFIYLYGIEQGRARPEDIPAIRGVYAGLVSLVDRWVGFLLDAVERMELFEDTIIVFTSDHGTEIGEHGLIQKHAHLLHPPVVRLPLIVHVPGRSSAGRRVGEFVSAVDFMPTFLGLMDLDGPEGMTGLDFWPTVQGQAVRDHVVTGFGWHGSVRNAEWNYIFPTRPDPGVRPRLYNVREDPEEQTNVLSDCPEAVEQMKGIARTVWPEDIVG